MTLISEETVEERGDSTTNNNLENHDDENNINTQIMESSHYSTPTAYSNDNTNIETPGGSRYWLPYVKDNDKPIRGKIYGSFEETFRIYKEYAIKSGFDIKLSSSKKTKSGMMKTKYIRCNRHGDPPSVNINTLDKENSGKLKRKSTFQVTGCNAHVMIKLVDCTNTYKLHLFVEEHNHPLNPIEYRHLSKENRKLGMPELMFMKQMADSNYGATVSYNLYCNTKGGYSHVSGTKTDFKNFKRDLNVFIGESDAQMLVTKLTNREEYVKDFSFSCDIKNSELECFFWADETAKANYKEFGDIISFDATYCTNRYSMIFVPFTAIDNHKKCVTIGAGMLRNETTETYIWLLKAFLDAFKKQPRIILTDQDPAMKRAIATVLPETKHRLCMWHIVTKFTVKIDRNIIDHTDFRPRLHQLIWNKYHKPEIFEQKWNSLLEEFNLQDNVWLAKLFEIRATWIPAYFIEYDMCGLMRTTSRSESENSFFNHFTSYGSTLINFMNLFESAMEKQRHEQEILDHQTLSKTPKLRTRWPIEEHARNVYTKEIFFLVQEEIDNALYLCSQISITTEEGCEIMMIRERTNDKQQNYKGKTKGKGKKQEQNDVEPFSEIAATEIQLQVKKEATFKVKHNIADETYVCTCNHFVRCGILCRHIFCVLQSSGIDEIPEKYITRRWKRDLIPPSVRNKTHRYEGNLTEQCQKLANEACRSVESCIAVLRNDEEKLAYFVEKLKNLKIEVEKDVPEKNKTEMMEEILGVKKPDQIFIHNPKGIKNKGSGSNSRMQGYGERAQKANERPYRTCGDCGLIVNTHDRRTCKGIQIELVNLQKLPHPTHQQQQQLQQLLNTRTTTTEINAANQSEKEQLQHQNVQPTAQRQTRGKKVARQAYKDVSEEESDYDTYDTLSEQRKKQKTTRSNAATKKSDYVLRDDESDYETSNVGT